jgi:iron complex transport system substrate-binding protein
MVAWIGLLAAATSAVGGVPPRRVISLSPNLTETIFALGAGDRVVGVSDFCVGPPEALRLPRVGGWANPNFERIAALEPDLIVVLGRHEAVADFALRRGIAVAQVPMMNLATIRSGIADMGRLLDCQDRATSLTAAIDAQLAAFRAELAAHPDRPRPRVFMSMTRAPGAPATLFTIGGDSFLDEALRLAGGVNVFHDVAHPFPEVSRESLVARRPEVILELEAGAHFSPRQRRQLIDDWRPLAALPAVRDGRIDVLTDADLLIAGPGFPRIVRRLRQALWGEPGSGAAASGAGD